MPPVVAAIGSVVAAVKASAVFTFLTTSFVGKLLVSVALSALGNALARREMRKAQANQRTPGIVTEVTSQGGNNPQSFILGTYATAGNEAVPANSHGDVGGTPRAYLTYVLDVSDIPVEGLNRMIVNDSYVTISGTVHPEYGNQLTGPEVGGNGWVKFYRGDQTAADPMLLAKYGADPDRPFTADMVGLGVAYAIVTFQYDRELFNAPPRVLFEVNGVRLYDPRFDTSVGGSGAQRWNNPATWAFTRNPAVMVYNILRGITFPDGRRWGGEATASDLPLANWFTAMNACDAPISVSTGGTEPAYRAAYEVKVDDEPADIIDELLKACSASIYESGGVWKIRVGGPGLPVKFITDEDLLITEKSNFLPFISMGSTYNAIHASYPEPAELYAVKDAPSRYNADWEAQDGDRRLVADVTLPAVPYTNQVQRLMRAWIEEERRFRRHNIFLPQDAATLEPLDTVAWTSAANGYTSKVFEISTKSEQFLTMKNGFLIRERDAADYNWIPAYELPVEFMSPGLTPLSPQSVVGFGVSAFGIPDASDTQRRPAIRMLWTTAGLTDIQAIKFEIRLTATGEVVSAKDTANFEAGYFVTEEGLLPDTAYQVRAMYVPFLARPVSWTSWIPVVTPALYLTNDDFEEGVYKLFRDQDLYAIRDVAILPAAGAFPGEKVFLTTTRKLFQWTGTDWEIVVAEPDTFIASDKIVANTITGGLLATSGIITSSAQIGDLVVTNAKIGNLAVDTLKIAGRAVTSMGWADTGEVPLGSYVSSVNEWLGVFGTNAGVNKAVPVPNQPHNVTVNGIREIGFVHRDVEPNEVIWVSYNYLLNIRTSFAPANIPAEANIGGFLCPTIYHELVVDVWDMTGIATPDADTSISPTFLEGYVLSGSGFLYRTSGGVVSGANAMSYYAANLGAAMAPYYNKGRINIGNAVTASRKDFLITYRPFFRYSSASPNNLLIGFPDALNQTGLRRYIVNSERFRR